MKFKPVKSSSRVRLRDAEARMKDAPERAGMRDALKKEQERLGALQSLLFADRRYALLVVLQGRDACGKGGTIRHVFDAVNPQGCEVSSFKAPAPLELEHDYLWRVHHEVPARGMIGIFDRSHYEDVLVPRVRKLVPEDVWSARYAQINDFERMLSENRVVILKFFLHVSRAEQKRRLAERLADPEKNWKFNAGDLDDRRRWTQYTAAYRDMLRNCSTPWAPWYVVPADDNRERNWIVATTIVKKLESLKLRYPPAPRDVLKLKIT